MSKPRQSSHSGPNPQGKGVVPVLRDLGALLPAVTGPKLPEEFLRDYCISSLVLAADFRFKPVVGKNYYLYVKGQGWNLSMVAPDEWGARKRGMFLAGCRLRGDMTWELDASDLEERSPAPERARQFIEGFVETLDGQDSIRGHLPFYAGSLPYYQRLLATALAASLAQSMPARGDDMKALVSDRSAGRRALMP